MRTAAIITEYDPFHSGHAWQVARLRELGFDRVAVSSVLRQDIKEMSHYIRYLLQSNQEIVADLYLMAMEM